MNHHHTILGIDIGSVAVSVIEITRARGILASGSAFHHGDIRSGLEKALASISYGRIASVCATSSTPGSVIRDSAYDDQVAIIRAARHLHPGLGALLNVGGEKFNLSLFGELGNYVGSRHNTSCAAGTGSFLDQQAARLGLENSQALSQAAMTNDLQIPDIATRCAVFAKTDLIHAQQEGFSIPQICDGLCRGLARNIANTLFTGTSFRNPLIFCGGVSVNEAVKKHLEAILKHPLICDSVSHLYGALGAALCHLDAMEAGNAEDTIDDLRFNSIDDFFRKSESMTGGVYPALNLSLSLYPDFSSFSSFVDESVETDIYEDPSVLTVPMNCFLGLDVGSTSTKGVLVKDTGEVLAGFYTKTASRPVTAVKAIIKSADLFVRNNQLELTIIGCGTTGSGRKLSGGVIGADLVLDEITAHARAAYELNADVDTIIEIGGQDAKFTTMKNGVVTSSFMNTVCAAGTGSFIEEQATKLGCALAEYSARTESVTSPVSSDRCTVFMERDINHFLSEGYSVDQVLASTLHSVRDNYLSKVASVGNIGNTILFQGATAKNKALVAAFEQKLDKPIHVSRYCHLTGALGVALTLMDQGCVTSLFRGFDLWQKEIPVRQETCSLCTNHCKLTIADIGGETVAFGFLCGRDYNTDHYVAAQKHFHLLKQRKKCLKSPEAKPVRHSFTIGLPSALHMVEDLGFWEVFFGQLGIRTVSSESMKSPVALGRSLANAEFCTPMTSMHGHVAWLMDRSDYVFLPYYFENHRKPDSGRRQYCYYTQFLPAVIDALPGLDTSRLISPVIKDLYTQFHTKLQLYKAFKCLSSGKISFFDISAAYDRAVDWKKQAGLSLQTLFTETRRETSDIDVLVVGRPYTVLSESLNCRIPDIFSMLKINLFFQDMIDLETPDFSDIDPLLRELHWEHASTILKAALVAARTDNLYPVYVTSFKCSPDSFGVDYFKKIMEAHNKPYLILELDDHDSSIGYETRIEAAIRAFRNHRSLQVPKKPRSLERINPAFTSRLADRTVIIPNWDPITGEFLAATLRGEGYETLLMEETTETIKQSLQTNTGQCIPLNAIACGFAKTVTNHNLDPAKTLLWMSTSEISCNIKLYPHHIKTLLAGYGMGKADVYKGELCYTEISIKAAVNAYFAYMFGGLIRSVGCRIRPYELIPGETDKAIRNFVKVLIPAFEGSRSREDALAEAISPLAWIKTRPQERPKVGIFGDFYVRDNDVMNQDLVRFIEQNGGEVVTTPYYRLAKMIAGSYFSKWFKEGKYMNLISSKALLTAMKAWEKRYYKYFEHLLNQEDCEYTDSYEDILREYGLLPEHTGESMDNILKIHYTVKQHPDLALFVQTSPSFCCPALVTEAMAGRIEKKTGVPVVSITYDASGGNRNRVLMPFLHYSRKNYPSQKMRKSI